MVAAAARWAVDVRAAEAMFKVAISRFCYGFTIVAMERRILCNSVKIVVGVGAGALGRCDRTQRYGENRCCRRSSGTGTQN